MTLSLTILCLAQRSYIKTKSWNDEAGDNTPRVINATNFTAFLFSVIISVAARMKHINLSFAACGFLGIYHLGAASALCTHGKKLLKEVKAFAGASAGSLVATILLTAPEKIEVMK